MTNATEGRFRRALDVGLLRFVGATLLDADDPAAGLELRVDDRVTNAAGVLHAGVTSTLLELSAYFALVPQLDDAEEALTHGFAASYIAAAAPGETVHARGTVLRRTRPIAFVSAVVSSAEAVIATATVTKSIRATR